MLFKLWAGLPPERLIWELSAEGWLIFYDWLTKVLLTGLPTESPYVLLLVARRLSSFLFIAQNSEFY